MLTTVLLITVYCLRKRKQARYAQKDGSMVSGTTNSSGPEIIITPNQSFRLPRHPSAHHSFRSQTPTLISGVMPATAASPIPPALPQSQPPSSTPRSGATSNDNTASEAEFHTIRECLGDFRNNNNSPALVHTHSCPKLNNHHIAQMAAHQQVAQQHPCSRTISANTRPMWVPHPHPVYHTCGRTTPYETVACPHGATEHVYQPLEHVYEEPHIWMQPLPNPHNTINNH